MLDAETKRRIDTARDILVGKVPDPKSQVEQITIALIYKFMDDMDKESIEMGGKPSFFTGEYENYRWSNIFDPRIGGYEMLNLYADAITRMSQNPNLPELFRNIFKNAYLPYRDPETLRLFLKTINEFSYDHSERLGDAFEYLLSVLGSQGDAGQFRTPRHIIDFMVKIVDPRKNETILDPACGTAGFLISAYKHIIRENTSQKYRSKNGNGMGDLLTPDERKRLLTNFKGYDISPDMVRISLVNMYLHGFVNPQIYEYDTLTSEDRWNEYADVVLANPPFMTPKGGIKPHKRFSVQSKRSEVLFVNYIAEHLTPTGRAAVIVPEGIIFQSANAYKQLRKMLVENYLYAVVSLPAGVFQPYSGVKTSILLMDKVLAKMTDSILFIKIENDGFDLGAQRRPIDRNDLPDALQVIREYIDKVRNGKADEFTTDEKPCSTLLVKKEKLAENGEYNLTGDRYRVVEKRKHQKWPMVKLGEVCEIKNGFAFKSENLYKDKIDNNFLPVIKIGNLSHRGYINNAELEYHMYSENLSEFLVKKDDLLVALTGATVGKTSISQSDNYLLNQRVGLIRSRKNLIYQNYLKILLFSDNFYNYCQTFAAGGAQGNISPANIKNFQIPLPPLEVQQEIVAEIEGYQKIIDGCRQVIDAWKPDVETYLDEELKTYIANHPEKQEELAEGWQMVKLGVVCDELFAGGDVPKEHSKIRNEIYYIPIYTNGIEEKSLYGFTNKVRVYKECVTISARGTIGYSQIRKKPFYPAIRLIVAVPNTSLINLIFLKYIIDKINVRSTGNTIPQLTVPMIRDALIPLPPLEVQSRIVDKIEAERKVIDSLREMVIIYEEKIKKVIDKVWGE